MRKLLLGLALSALGCGGAPFTMAPEQASAPIPDAASVEDSPAMLIQALDAGSPEATPEAGLEASRLEPSLEASALEASASALLLPFRCVAPSGYVACDSGGGWTVSYAGETCDASHSAIVGCVQGSACSFYQQGGMHYEGTCQP